MDTGRRVAVVHATKAGAELGSRVAALYEGATLHRFSPGLIPRLWVECGTLVFVMAAGIVVRSVAPLVRDKRSDPAVVVLDEKGRYAVSLLSGHLGGANERAKEIAKHLGGEAVITTASDVNGVVSLDLWARDNGLVIEDWELVPRAMTRLLDRGSLKVYSELAGLHMPAEFEPVQKPEEADLLITNKRTPPGDNGSKSFNLPDKAERLCLRPRNLVVGIGCNSGTPAAEIGEAVRAALRGKNLSFLSIHSLATINKKAKEPGLVEFAKNHFLDIVSFTPDELNRVMGVQRSEAAFRATGAQAVAEPAALLCAGNEKLLINKQKTVNVTVAVAERRKGMEGSLPRTSGRKPHHAAGKIFVVGTGPGDCLHITPRAGQAIAESEAVVGYGTYLDLIPGLIKGKEVHSTGMTQEVDRCRKAIELAMTGRTVSVVSGGDPGIYAMAGLVFELLRAEARGVPLPQVEVVPGVSALNACAARLGAPLMHDFASISLSDRLTPWDLIERRLEAAAAADFVIVLYNPKSRGRANHIDRAREIILCHRGTDTPVGIVRAAMRADETVVLTDLGAMLEHEIDMQTTVIIGNSQSFAWQGRMITPRGYEKKIG